MKEELREKELEKVVGGQIMVADDTNPNRKPGRNYDYMGTCRVCNKVLWNTKPQGKCFCGGDVIWTTRK